VPVEDFGSFLSGEGGFDVGASAGFAEKGDASAAALLPHPS